MNVSSSLSGMHAADLMLSTAADNVANADTPDYFAERVDLVSEPAGGVRANVSRAPEAGVDYAEEAVTQVVGQFLYAANAKAVEAQRETEQSLFDMLA